MALLSGEVETCGRGPKVETDLPFRMALLSGEVETRMKSPAVAVRSGRSGWLCYPGKLKPLCPP